MPIIFKLQDIDEAIGNLRYKNETTLKSRLLRAVRQYYSDDAAAESLQAIDVEELVKTIWETGDDSELLKTKRKNFSSVKSSVNSDLKKLYTEGKNPQGIVIGHDNIFTISDEAKDKALAGIMDVFKEKGIDTQSKISEILTAVNDILSTAISGADADNTKEEIERLKDIMGGLSGKLGLSFQDLINRAASGGGAEISGSGVTREAALDKNSDLPGDIRGGMSMLGDGLREIAREVAEEGYGLARSGIRESLRKALGEIVQAIGDAETDVSGKAKKIMTAVEGILSDSIDAVGDEFSVEEARQLKRIFHDMAENAGDGNGATSSREEPPAADRTVTPANLAGSHLLADVSSILSSGELSAGDKMNRIMNAVKDVISEALAETGTGLSDEEKAHIQEMMEHVTDNLEAFAEEVLNELVIIEETVEEAADEVVEEIVDDGASPPIGEPDSPGESVSSDVALEDAGVSTVEEVIEFFEDFPEETQGSAADSEELDQAMVTDVPPDAGLIEEPVEDGMEVAEEIIEVDTEASSAGTDAMTEETAMGTSIGETTVILEDISALQEGSAAEGEDATARIQEDTFDETQIVEEIIEEGAGEISIPETSADDAFEVVEEIVGDDIAGEGAGDARTESQATLSDKTIDDDLREKEDLLSRLAEAAGTLEKLGPDLSGSIYTEDEIRGKAKMLSEEFDRYLSIRDKYFNAHILIRGGNYLVGGNSLAKSVLPQQVASLPDFYIGKFPVTNALFEIFVEQTGYVTTAEKYGYGLVYFPRMQRSRDAITGVERFILHKQAYSKKVPGACWHRPFGRDSSLHLKRTHPVVQVSLDDARAFAAWTGKRLPTEIEWEAAARATQGLLFPWGNQWQDNACNIEKSLHGDTTAVDHYAKFANADEVADMLGNVLEWTLDIIGNDALSDPCIVKGASWISHGEICLTDRHYIEKNTWSNILGFRCVAI